MQNLCYDIKLHTCMTCDLWLITCVTLARLVWLNLCDLLCYLWLVWLITCVTHYLRDTWLVWLNLWVVWCMTCVTHDLHDLQIVWLNLCTYILCTYILCSNEHINTPKSVRIATDLQEWSCTSQECQWASWWHMKSYCTKPLNKSCYSL